MEESNSTIEETNSTLSLLYDNIVVIGTITTFIPLKDILNLPQICKSIRHLTIPFEILELQRVEKPFHGIINHNYHYLDPSDLRRKVKVSIRELHDIYSEFMRVRSNDFGDFGEEVELPADLCRISCDTCEFNVFLWIHFCEGAAYEECKSSSTVARLVIGKCKSCDDALTECRKCTIACQQCKGDLCMQCSCGEFSRSIGRTLCHQCAGNKYDHLLSKHQTCDY